jgi:hypothetical protein
MSRERFTAPCEVAPPPPYSIPELPSQGDCYYLSGRYIMDKIDSAAMAHPLKSKNPDVFSPQKSRMIKLRERIEKLGVPYRVVADRVGMKASHVRDRVYGKSRFSSKQQWSDIQAAVAALELDADRERRRLEMEGATPTPKEVSSLRARISSMGVTHEDICKHLPFGKTSFQRRLYKNYWQPGDYKLIVQALDKV